MHSRFRMKGVLLAVLVALLANAALPDTASAEPQPGVRKKGFRLFARALGALVVNRVYCGLASDGRVCVDSTNSSTIGGGFWPKGTPDQYVFNSGLQVAGVIGTDGGPWANDTVGGFFFDPKGTTEHGEEVAPIYNASNVDDLNNWPAEACVPTAANDVGGSLFDPILQADPFNTSGSCVGGRKSASQGDVWFMSWEGNNNLRAGRKHPIGVTVESRGMGWNFPAGNDDVLYFIYTFYNTSVIDGCPGAPNPGVNPYEAQGARPAIAAILCRQALALHAQMAAAGVDLPDAGYTMTNLFAAFAADMDVAEAGSNYASVNLPFALGYTYDHSFSQPPSWSFDPRLFAAPFFQGAGFVGVKYLKSPTGAGQIQLFSNTANTPLPPGAIGDPRDVSQLYRYLSGTLSPTFGDAACNTGNPLINKICYINNTAPADMRFFQSSTGLTLAPGAQGSIVVAYIFAAPVATAGCGAGCDVAPGNPLLLTSTNQLQTIGANTIDSLTGFISYTDGNVDNVVEQGEFKVVPGSLLDKALVAQAVFNNKFLLPFAPEVPAFFLIPGDNQVTILWQPTTSEQSGDPFFTVAQQPTVLDPGGNVVPNNLYDPNYRFLDVEGYRIYRGRVDSPNELTLLAQFDYSGTVISDFAGQVNPTDECAPEINIQTNCLDSGGNSITFDPVVPGVARTTSTNWDLSGNIIQVQFGKRAALLNGKVIITGADTAVVGGGTRGPCAPSACPALSNTGVPFIYIDPTPRNNFRYFYAVTAFDVNSFQSSPSSLESPRRTQSVTPVAGATNYVNSAAFSFNVVGRGVAMDTIITADPTIDQATGKFSGPQRPANGLLPAFIGALPQQLVPGPTVSIQVTLDSMTMGESDATDFAGLTDAGDPAIHYVTVTTALDTVQLAVPINVGDLADQQGGGAFFNALAPDSALASRYGGAQDYTKYTLKGTVADSIPGINFISGWGLGCRFPSVAFQGNVNGSSTPPDCFYNGPRWFDGPSTPMSPGSTKNETKDDPNGDNCGISGNDPLCVTPGLYNTAGEVTTDGTTKAVTVYVPQAYVGINRRWRNFEYDLGTVYRAADMNVYWGAGGKVDSVIDATHNVPVKFSPNAGATWGILNATNPGLAGSADGASKTTVITVADLGCVEPLRSLGNPGLIYPCTTTATFDSVATLGDVALFQGANTNVTTAPIRPTQGFMLYVAGVPTIFEVAALPNSGTVWTLRTYAGHILGGKGAGGNTGLGYRFTGVTRPLNVPGATVVAQFAVQNTLRNTATADLKRVHTVPDPYYVTNQFESSTDNKVIKFVNLPQQAIIRIYSSSGVLVNILEHNSTTFSGEETWNVRNRNNQVVASGVYFYHIEATGQYGGKARRVGRFTVVNFAQ